MFQFFVYPFCVFFQQEIVSEIASVLERISLDSNVQVQNSTEFCNMDPGRNFACENDTKDWQTSITADLRNHIAHKIAQAILPFTYSAAIPYANELESELYKMANSRSQYYHLVAEKIYKIQRELEERRLNCQEQLEALNQVATTSATAMALDQLQQTINQLKTDPNASNPNSNTSGGQSIHPDDSMEINDKE